MIMATIVSQLNSGAGIMTMMGWKHHDKVFAFPSSRQVTSINFPSSFKYQSCSWQLSTYNSHLITTNSPSTHPFYSSPYVCHCTTSSLSENYYDNDGERFMMMKPSNFTKPPSSRNFIDAMSRILASLFKYGVVFTFVTMAAFFYTSNSALAGSYGRIGGSSSSSSHGSSSSSSSYDQSSIPYYWSSNWIYFDEDDSSVTHTCTCETSCKDSNSSVTHTCTCETSCANCINCNIRGNAYKQEEEQDKNSCSCNCHSTCYFHKKVDHSEVYIFLACIILFSIIYVYVEVEKVVSKDRKGTMLIFQAGVSDKRRMLQRNLNNIAENADTSTLNGLNCVLKEVVRALQHDSSSLNYSYLYVNHQPMESLSKSFQEILNGLLQVYGKDDNTLGNVYGVKYKKRTKMVEASSRVDNEYTLATIMVLATGLHSFPRKKEKGKTYVDSLAVLKSLQHFPTNNIQSVEVLWTPQREDEVLFEEQIRNTTMTRVENGHIFM